MISKDYTVKMEAFEGPLDLLLHLIEKRKMHISDISLEKITDDYLSYIEKGDDVPMYMTAQFILVASTLVLIKSKSLLPILDLTDEEEESMEELENRLREYKKFRDLSVIIGDNFGQNRIFFRKHTYKTTPVFSPTNEVTIDNIFVFIKNIIKSLPKKEMIPQIIIKKILTLEEMAEDLTERITSAFSLTFKDFTEGKNKDKNNVLIGFLAMLELVKRGIIVVKQDKNFEDIYMESVETSTPKYL